MPKALALQQKKQIAFNIHLADCGNKAITQRVFAQPSEGIQILVRNYPAWAWIATHFWNLWDAPVGRGAKPCTISPTVLDLVKNEIIDLLVRMFVLPSFDPDGVDGYSVDASDPNASTLRLFNLGELKQRWQNHEYEEVGRREIALLNARDGKDDSIDKSTLGRKAQNFDRLRSWINSNNPTKNSPSLHLPQKRCDCPESYFGVDSRRPRATSPLLDVQRLPRKTQRG